MKIHSRASTSASSSGHGKGRGRQNNSTVACRDTSTREIVSTIDNGRGVRAWMGAQVVYAQRRQLAFAVAVDTSSSMAGKPLDAAINGVEHIVRMMEPTDMFELSTFDTDVRNLHHPMPRSRVNVAKDWENVRANNRSGGRTALWDAINAGIDELHEVHARQHTRRERGTRQVGASEGSGSPQSPQCVYHQIIITDGKDNASSATKDELCRRVAHPGVPNYHLTLVAVNVCGSAARKMQQVVSAAGNHGRFIHVASVGDLEQQLQRQAERIHLSLQLTSRTQCMSITVETSAARAPRAVSQMLAASSEGRTLADMLGSLGIGGNTARPRRALASH